MVITTLRKAWIILPACSLALLAACGTSSGVDYPGFISRLNSSLAAIYTNTANYQGLTNLLSSKYMQDGISSSDLSAMLAADAAALPNDVAYPTVTYSNPVVGTCDSNNICDLTVTATNSDADSVSVTLTLKVTGTPSMLIGDQSNM